MTAPSKISWTWRSIFKLKDAILPLVRYTLHHSEATSFWDDPWIDRGVILRRVLTYADLVQTGVRQDATVQSFIHGNAFRLPRTSNYRIQQFWNMAAKCEVTNGSRCTVQWGSTAASFSINETYAFLIGAVGEKSKWRRRIWRRDNSQTDNLLHWKVINRALNTKVKLLTRGVPVDVCCVFCHQSPKLVEHLFFECAYLNNLWKSWIMRIGRQWKGTDNGLQWKYIYDNTGGKRDSNRLFLYVVKRFMKVVWDERNRRIFRPEKSLFPDLFERHLLREIRRDICHVSFTFDPGIFC